MNILLCGANGFIGGHIERALRLAGHTVRRGVSRAKGPDDIAIDYSRDATSAVWLPRLQGIDVVINAVGILRGSARRPMQTVHTHAPAALFKACAEAGVRRVIQISALGIESNDSAYAVTKRRADDALLALNAAGRLDGVVVRPSIVFGEGGESTALFLGLARLPVLVLPQLAMRARVQPVHVLELAEAVARLAATAREETGIIECAGPEATPLGGFIASLRTQRGSRAARVIGLPDWMTKLSARTGDLVPISPWGTQALSLMSQDNVGSPAAMTRLLGRAPTHFSCLLAEKAGA